MKQTKLSTIKKVLMSGRNIVIGEYAKNKMLQYGYEKGDLATCILQGKIVEVHYGKVPETAFSTFQYVIQGSDMSGNPMSLTIVEDRYKFQIIHVMPQIMKLSECI